MDGGQLLPRIRIRCTHSRIPPVSQGSTRVALSATPPELGHKKSPEARKPRGFSFLDPAERLVAAVLGIHHTSSSNSITLRLVAPRRLGSQNFPQ